jgi:hypothetical protein
MRWFFAYNGRDTHRYHTHIEVMVRSAAANTSLEPHMIYCGPPDDPILAFAKSHGVNVIQRQPSILPDLERIKAKFPDYLLGVATGAFLRIDLPIICQDLGFDDQYVLYTDLDVMFLGDIPAVETEAFLRPALFSCAPETAQTDWVGMNTGVMVMNVKALLDDYSAFRSFVTSGDTLYYELYKEDGSFDQSAYQRYYASKWDKLPVEYNWKPYWGFNEDALIVHFHGPKILEVRKMMDRIPPYVPKAVKALYHSHPDSYKAYLSYVDRYASD